MLCINICCIFCQNELKKDSDGLIFKLFPVSETALSRQPSRVDFIPNTAQPQPTMPPDISREEYLDPSDVQTAPIPRSQIGTVITSYEKTIGNCCISVYVFTFYFVNHN